jgi:hypothetical protein
VTRLPDVGCRIVALRADTRPPVFQVSPTAAQDSGMECSLGDLDMGR